MINSLQIIAILPLMSVDFPANAQSMFQTLNNIFSVNIIDFSAVQQAIFTFMEDRPLNDNFDEYGYASSNVIQLLQNNYFVIWIFFLVQVAFTLMR